MTINNLIRGIDVSSIQGTNIPWQEVAASGIQFVICRNGIGNSGLDGTYKNNIAQASAAGLKVAAYNVIYPLPPLASQPLRDPVKQAQYHFNAAEGALASIDAEWPLPGAGWAQWGCSAPQIRDWMSAYLKEYTRLDGRNTIIYSYPDWLQSVKLDASFVKYPLWLASYTANPVSVEPWGTNWTWWQNSGGSQNLPGTTTPVDTDYARDLSLWGVQLGIAPPPPVAVINTPDPIVEPTNGIPVVTAPVVVVAPPAPANPDPAPQANPSVITAIENTLKNEPGVLNAIQNVVVKVITKLFHIR